MEYEIKKVDRIDYEYNEDNETMTVFVVVDGKWYSLADIEVSRKAARDEKYMQNLAEEVAYDCDYRLEGCDE